MLLSGFRWRSCLVYLEDLIIFYSHFKEHLDHVRDLLRVLVDAGMSLKLRTCNFFSQKVN